MAKKKLIVGDNGDLKELPPKPYEIKSAQLKDDFLLFSYELRTGPTVGDEIKRKGGNIVHEDLKNHLSNLDFHLAFIDNSLIEDVEFDESSPIVNLYHASGFKLQGDSDNLQVIISGTKQTRYGYIDFDAPKINLTGNYKHKESLDAIITDCIIEVEAYMNGKSAPKFEQGSLEFNENESI